MAFMASAILRRRAKLLDCSPPERRCGTAEIMRRSGKSKPVVGTWQARFMTAIARQDAQAW